MELIDTYKVSMTFEDLKNYMRVASLKAIEELVKEYGDYFLELADPDISRYLLQSENVDRKAHMKIIADKEDSGSVVKIIAANDSIIPVTDWNDVVISTGDAYLIYKYGKAFRSKVDLNGLKDAILALTPTAYSAHAAVEFAYECFTDSEDRLQFEDFVKRSKNGMACIAYAHLIKEFFDIDELLEIAAADGEYNEIASHAYHRFYHDGLNKRFLQKLQYYVLRGKDEKACRTFMYQARGGSCRQENLTLKDGFDIELLLNEIALYSTDRETRRKTLKELQGMDLKLMTKEEYDKCTSNYDAYTYELQEAEERETEREIRRRKAEERQLRRIRERQSQSDDDFELPFR